MKTKHQRQAQKARNACGEGFIDKLNTKLYEEAVARKDTHFKQLHPTKGYRYHSLGQRPIRSRNPLGVFLNGIGNARLAQQKKVALEKASQGTDTQGQ